MEGTASQTRPKPAHDPPQSRKAGPGQARGNPSSPEVISNLIFSLSSISDQSEQLFDRLIPAQDKAPRPPSRSSRRAQASYANGKEAPPPVPTLVREEVANADRTRPEPNLDTKPTRPKSKHRSSDFDTTATTTTRRLPAVQEVTSPTSPALALASSPPTTNGNRPRVGSQPPPASLPRRSMSLRTVQLAPVPAQNEGATEAFASISVMPGKTNNESVTSSDSAGKRLVLGRVQSTQAKSAKDRIREMDAERKKRKARAAKGAGTSRPNKSPSLGKGSSPLPSPGMIADEYPPSPMGNGFLSGPQSPGLPTRNTGEDVSGEIVPDDGTTVPFAASSKQAGGTPSRPGTANGKGVFVPPRASSTRQSIEIPNRSSSRASSPGRSRSRAGSKAKPSSEVPRLPFDRDEADTNKRIEELQRAKAERKQKEEQLMMAKLQQPPRSVLGDIMPNGGVTHLDAQPSGPGDRKMSVDQSRKAGAKSALSNAGSEARDSLQINRTFVPTFTARSREYDTLSVTDSIDDAVEDYVGDPRLSQVIYHPQSKRAISYSDVGDPNGAVIICCIGMGTTRYVSAFFDEVARTFNLRIITPERPGIGDSEPYGPTEMDTPLAWPDDVRLICTHLGIKRFMLLAHSAGAVYALATALRMPSEIRGRVHLLAPWIPPSQLNSIGLNEQPVPVAELPLIQRILRSIPDSLLEAATRIFNVSSITSSLGKSPHKKRRRNTTGAAERRRGETPALAVAEEEQPADPRSTASSPTPQTEGLGSPQKAKRQSNPQANRTSSQTEANAARFDEAIAELTEEEKMQEFNSRLITELWRLATSNANPAIDLTVCLERKQEIGFRYEDITKPVVMHHGTKDTRVSVENVVWLGDKMRRCDVRILEGEGHGLMASGSVMGNVLDEMHQDWEDWNALTRNKRGQL